MPNQAQNLKIKNLSFGFHLTFKLLTLTFIISYGYHIIYDNLVKLLKNL